MTRAAPPLTESQLARAIELREAKMSLQSIASHLEVSVNAVTRGLKGAGVHKPTKAPKYIAGSTWDTGRSNELLRMKL